MTSSDNSVSNKNDCLDSLDNVAYSSFPIFTITTKSAGELTTLTDFFQNLYIRATSDMATHLLPALDPNNAVFH